MYECCHGHRGHQDHHNREPKDRSELATKVTQWKGDGAPVQKRPNEDQKQDVRRELEPRQIGHEREHQSAHHEHRRIWNGQASGQDPQARGDGEEEQDEFEAVHVSKIEASCPRRYTFRIRL